MAGTMQAIDRSIDGMNEQKLCKFILCFWDLALLTAKALSRSYFTNLVDLVDLQITRQPQSFTFHTRFATNVRLPYVCVSFHMRTLCMPTIFGFSLSSIESKNIIIFFCVLLPLNSLYATRNMNWLLSQASGNCKMLLAQKFFSCDFVPSAWLVQKQHE